MTRWESMKKSEEKAPSVHDTGGAMNAIHLELLVKITESRKTAKALMGDKYEDHASKWREVVSVAAEEAKCGYLKAAMILIAHCQLDKTIHECSPMWILAATADLIETEGVKGGKKG